MATLPTHRIKILWAIINFFICSCCRKESLRWQAVGNPQCKGMWRRVGRLEACACPTAHSFLFIWHPFISAILPLTHIYSDMCIKRNLLVQTLAFKHVLSEIMFTFAFEFMLLPTDKGKENLIFVIVMFVIVMSLGIHSDFFFFFLKS